jgi:hypothetical protein
LEGNNEVISNLSAAKHTSLQYSNLFQKYPNVLKMILKRKICGEKTSPNQ